MTDIERTGWKFDMSMDMWMNGRHGIGIEVIAGWPRAQVQQYAIEKTGQPLPDEAFGKLDGMALAQASIKDDESYALSRRTTTP